MSSRSCSYFRIARSAACLLVLLGTLVLSGWGETPPDVTGAVSRTTAAHADGGANEGMSRFPTGPQSGLWAGNVEIMPEEPVALPAAFYERPPGDPSPYPDGIEMRP